jgi:hypothetical protein
MRFTIPLIVAATLLPGCRLLGFEGFGGDDDYREKWARQHDGDYSYVLTRGCFCALGGTYWVQVVDYEVAVVIETYSQQPVDSTMFEYIETIEDMFDLIDRAREEGADELHVEYAPEGYPKVTNIDWYREAVDDEMFMGISEVIVGIAQID